MVTLERTRCVCDHCEKLGQGHIPVKNEATTAPQSLVSVKRTVRVDERVEQIL